MATSSRSTSQSARLEQQICAVGRIWTGPSRQPAGTLSSAPSIWTSGSADPHSTQKLRWCRVPGSRKILTSVSPATQWSDASVAKRLAPWAVPLPFRHREQWQRKKLLKEPLMSKRTVPQRQEPEMLDGFEEAADMSLISAHVELGPVRWSQCFRSSDEIRCGGF